MSRMIRICFIFLVTVTALHICSFGRSAESSDFGLQGLVSSDDEGRMEGVLVSAKAVGSTVTVTVVSDNQGRYAFPNGSLHPGTYQLTIRAVGYDYDHSAAIVAANKTTRADLKLHKTRDLAPQLTNAEWMLSIPGTEQQKRMVDCVGCHTIQPIVQSDHNSMDWLSVLNRMANYAPPSSSFRAIKLPFTVPANPTLDRPLADYLSSINLSSVSKWEYPLKTLARPTGLGTKVLITEYDLPRRESQPHDATIDSQGGVWYTDFAVPYIGRLNPKTAQVVEYPTPEVKSGFIRGATDIEVDRDGNPWISMLFQGAIAKFDKRAHTFKVWSIPADYNNVRSRAGMLAVPRYGKDRIWFSDNTNLRMHRLDPLSAKIDTFLAFPKVKDSADEYARGAGRRYSIYGIAVDSQGNGYFSNIQGGQIGKVDAITGKVTLYPTPTTDSGPRRFYIDSHDRLWFAEYRAHKLGMFDTKSQQFQEWTIPTPWSGPYDVVVDKNGEVWGGGMWNDRVFRFNPKTSQFIEYLLPSTTNIRRVDVDNSTNPVTFWTGNNHGASIIRLQPLQ